MIRPDLDALAALLDKATPGPWKMKHEFGEWLVGNDGYVTADCGRSTLMASPNNAALIVAAVNALPDMIAYVRALETAIRFHNDGLQQQCDARAAGGMCDAYRSRGKCCVDCPRDFVIDAAAPGREQKPLDVLSI